MVWIVVGLILALLIYLYIQNYLIETTAYTLTIPKLNDKMKGKKLVHLSDLHLKPRINKSFVETILNKTEDLHPDYILITGDLVQAGLEDFVGTPLRHFVEECAKIAPTYVATGNHDIASGSFDDFMFIIKTAKAHLLLDDAVILYHEDEPGLVLMGLAERQNQFNLPKPLLSSIELTEEMEELPKILMAHRPEHFERYMDDKTKAPALVLSGHTHAGQGRIPFLGGLYSPGQGFLPKYDYGIFTYSEDRSKRMIVSRGLGNSSFPLRINNRPEIGVITLN